MQIFVIRYTFPDFQLRLIFSPRSPVRFTVRLPLHNMVAPNILND